MGAWRNPTLRVFARGEDGNKYTFNKQGLPSYFFVPVLPKYSDDLKGKVKKITAGYTSIFGRPLWRVDTYAPGDTNVLREGYDHHEADIHWTERARIDLKLTDGFEWNGTDFLINNDVDHISLRTWVLDVEISSPGSIIPDFNTPQYDTVCIVVYDSFNKSQLTWSLDNFDNENSMWEAFLSTVKRLDPDVITGWNIGFDVSWILARLAYLGIDPNNMSNMGKAGFRYWTAPDGKIITKYDIAGRVVFDGLEAYKVKKNPSGQLSSYNLHAVAEKETKDVWDDLGPRIESEWRLDPKRVVQYCQRDVEVETKLIFKERLIDQALTLCRLSGCTPPQTLKKEAIIDHALLLRRGDRILPSKKRRSSADAENKVKGAVVLLPKPGIHKALGVYDAAALYPSIIAGFNISPETKNDKGTIIIEDENGTKYRFLDARVQRGILPESISEFRELRERVRKKKYAAEEQFGHDSEEYKALEEEDTADKFIITSFYGVNGFAGFRLFDPDCANAITAVGRKIINGLAEFLSAEGFPVEYGDTDSVFVSQESLENGDRVSTLIKTFLANAMQDMGVQEATINVKFEKFFEWCIFKRKKISKGKYAPVKKKYVAHMTWSEGEKTDYMYIRGFETRRSDVAPILKRTMGDFFEEMRKGDFGRAMQVLRDCKQKYKSLLPIELAIPRKITKDKIISSTTGREIRNPWIEGVRYGKKELKYQYDQESAPALIYVKFCGNKPKIQGICIQKHLAFPEKFEVDYEIMWEKTIKKKFEPLLEAMGYHWNIEVEGHTQLDQWFSSQ